MKKSKNILILFFCFVFLLVGFNFSYVQAEGDTDKEIALEDPLGMDNPEEGPQIFIGRIIDASLGVVGSLALLMFVYGGFTWMLAAGNSERVEKGKRILFWATVGLVVIFTSYIIVHFVIFELVGAPGGG